MCYQTFDLVDSMEKDSGIKISEIKVDGGMADNKKFIQNLSNILQVKIIRPNNIEASALGAAYLALLSSGIVKKFEDITHLKKNKYKGKDSNNFNPATDKSLAEKQLIKWKKAVSALLNYYE